MYRSGLLLICVLLLPFSLFGQRKEYVELMREVSLLAEQVRNLQRSQDEKMGAIQELVRQAVDSANRANTAIAVLESGFRDREKSLLAPIAGVNSKVEQMGMEFGSLREAVADTNARLGRLQQQLVDLSNAVKTMQAPAAPPPPQASALPPIPAETLYQNALRDRSGGKTELALQQFAEYLKYYGDTELAPNAHFYIAEIHYSQGELDTALEEFDQLLQLPENNKTPDALYMKGLTLVKLGKRTAGATEFREVVRRFPRSEVATKARAQLKAMGLSPTAPAAAGRKK